MGTVDKVIRLLVAVIVLVLYLTNVISGTLGIVLLVVAGVLVLTSLLGICPAYMPLGFTTLKKEGSK